MYFINTILFGFSLIILAAVRKGYKWSAGSSHDIVQIYWASEKKKNILELYLLQCLDRDKIH